MKKLIDTLISHISTYFSDMLVTPLIACLAAVAVFTLLAYIKKDKRVFNASTVFSVALLVFSCVSILQITLLSRIGTYVEHPLDRLWENRQIITSWKYKYDLSCILNVLLFAPFTFSICLLRGNLKGIDNKISKVIIICTALSFFVSLAIEVSQAVFHVGTFQIFDLIYNTIGGFIGAATYIIISKRKKR